MSARSLGGCSSVPHKKSFKDLFFFVSFTFHSRIIDIRFCFLSSSFLYFFYLLILRLILFNNAVSEIPYQSELLLSYFLFLLFTSVLLQIYNQNFLSSPSVRASLYST